ncbi:SGNH/GDSL hydrolase family protein [Streptomyces sp. DSM 44917]|uniref:SGNH/GDSL hydrolase family protein n=1 Tax=Streptomyces boetiae TaxID=3075541 RepID=A0ABU2LD43_9ACTN|nr:SGNH/GDSL hydrolase family protein [Streptomyces sp. DSM 44917]MDT0309401.1 SGNH/GDSL hydrolase family protein [Streptomyces sp. DSM 44917]
MASARVARRIATAAAYGGGGIGLLGGAAAGLVLTEVKCARRRVRDGGRHEEAPSAEGIYGQDFAARPGPPWRLALLGDSTAAGLGVRRAAQTPGALLASGLAAVSERPVELHNVALSGAGSADLERQVSLLLTEPGRAPVPDVCVIVVGANDITGRVPPARSVKYLAEAVARLRTAGCEVVVGTCPDLGSVEPVGQPLRWIARRLCRRLAAAQTIAVVELGGRTVSLGALLGPEFAAHPRELFGPDRYHPSADGYATAAMALLPTVCDAVGAWPAEERPGLPRRRERVLPVADAAARAAAREGTEVSAAEGLPGGAGGGRRTPWARLRLRRRRLLLPERDADHVSRQVTPEAT